MTELSKPLIDINKAPLKDLTTIRGIGPSLAQAIIENRPYETVNDLIRVPGIKVSKLKSITPYITLHEKKTKTTASKPRLQEPQLEAPVVDLGTTETFVFLEDRKDRQDALLIIFGGFIFGLLLLILRRSNQ